MISKIKRSFYKGKIQLFLLGPQNGIMESEDTTDKFGLMPYLSEDGSKNVFILNVNRFYGLNKKLENDPEKLEDALKVMKVLSTVEGTSALYPDSTLKQDCFLSKMQRQMTPSMQIFRILSMQGIRHRLFIPDGKIRL